ncbi:MAG: tripartite tricarboxylate transporter substrate binding protein [Betaproteobacteria bacterium]|nr:tripartite tricarboxylate transporter substrate binding protein [Betaproteobacteria bacterium]
MQLIHLVAAFVLAALVPFDVNSQDYPSKTIRFVVGYTAGGLTDIAARLIAQELGERLNTSIVVENREGAGGTIAATSVVRAPKDGYTLLFAASPELAIYPAIKQNMPYDWRRDFATITLVGTTPLLLAVHPSVSAASVKELVDLAKAQPGKLNYASFGAGTSNHLATELFKAKSGTSIVHVPYKGAGAAMPDFLAARVQMMFHSEPQLLSLVKEGKVRVLAYAAAQRSARLPEVPTMAEAGFPGFVVGSWVGVVGPSGIPAGVINRLNREIASVVDSARVRKVFGEQGTIPQHTTPEGFTSFIGRQIAELSELGKQAGISLD